MFWSELDKVTLDRIQFVLAAFNGQVLLKRVNTHHIRKPNAFIAVNRLASHRNKEQLWTDTLKLSICILMKEKMLEIT
jgi:hypothetical protein